MESDSSPALRIASPSLHAALSAETKLHSWKDRIEAARIMKQRAEWRAGYGAPNLGQLFTHSRQRNLKSIAEKVENPKYANLSG